MTSLTAVLRGIRLPLLLSLVLLPVALDAKNIGADPPSQCNCVKPPIPQIRDTSTSISRTEGNLSEQVPISANGGTGVATISLTATYNSYNADASRVTLNSVMGYGWTHSYNMFLFTQFGAMFEIRRHWTRHEVRRGVRAIIYHCTRLFRNAR